MSDDLPITPRLTIPARHLSHTAVRSSGPGGQNVNKVATKIDLRFDVEGCDVLSPAVKSRLREQAAGMLDGEGRVRLTSDSTRSQSANLEDAREKLAALIRKALRRPKRRRPTKPSRAAKRRRLDAKRKRSEKKKSRGRVRWNGD